MTNTVNALIWTTENSPGRFQSSHARLMYNSRTLEFLRYPLINRLIDEHNTIIIFDMGSFESEYDNDINNS